MSTDPETVESTGDAIVQCPTCGADRREFLIVDGKCDSCRSRDAQAQTPMIEIGWPEVRQRRNLLLSSYDFTQVDDYDAGRKAAMQPIRAAMRDITLQPDPITAWRELDRLNVEAQKAK